MRRLIALVGFCFLIAWSGSVVKAGVHTDYKSPLFTIPYTAAPPTVDGTVIDAQWQNALSINAFQTTEGAVSTRPTTVWMLWDDDHLYIAMRSPLRPGERVMQANRDPSRDNSKVVFDDSYEIWLNLGTRSPDGEIVFFQYLGNAAGAKYDVMFEPTVGNSRPGWESGWKPKNRITPDGKFWEMTVAIPRQSVYMNSPFTDGNTIHGLFVRNFKRPWEQNNIGGSGSFSVPETHCSFVLSKSAPAIHLLDVADPKNETFGLNLSASSATDQSLKWSFESDSGVTKAGILNMGKGAEAAINAGLDLEKPGNGYYRVKVQSDDGARTYLDWCSRRTFGDASAATQPAKPDTADQAELTLGFNPVQNYVRVEGDFINYDNRAAIKRYVAEVVDSQGRQLARKELTLDHLAYVSGLMQLGDCPAGAYTARLTCYDSDNKQVLQKETPFTKKDAAKEFPWWNTRAGNIEKVIDPWTPVRHHDQQIDVWGRTMTVGAAGLPSQITTQGKEILSGPMSLVAETDGGIITPTAGTIATDLDSDNRVIVHSDSKLGDLKVSSKTTAEFDGMYKVQLTLTPKQTASVKSLKVVIPINPEFADYIHACGEGIRYGFSYGYVPRDKTGQLWSSRQVDGQPMLVGSFIPYVWIGNPHGGLCWFADSDEGWVPDDKVPAIELRREPDGKVNLILNLISSDSVISAPRKITFAFQATPVKPIRTGWRMDTWSTGDSFKDFCRVEPKGGHLIWDALCFTLDPADCKRMVQQRQATDCAYNFGISKYHVNAVPYFENNSIDKKFCPEGEYFGDQWHARVSDSLCYEKTVSDYIIYHLDQWCKQTGIDGWYVDNVRPVADDNVDAGRGYRLPDGRIQPSYQMFDTREFFLRVRAVFAENGKSGKFVLHMTNHMIMPWIGAADLALDGEDHVTFPEMGKDFIDFWSLERMRLDYPGQSGVAPTFLEEYQGKWDHADLKRVIRAYTAMCILNDVMPSANPNGDNPEVWRGRDRFGIEAADVRFVPYWDKDNGVSVDGADLHASSWRKPGSVLIAVVNTGEAANPVLHLDLAKLSLPGADRLQAMDADTGEAMKLRADGSLQIEVNRHDYRQVIVKSPVQ